MGRIVSHSPNKKDVSTDTASTEKADRRIAHRYPLTASAELTELSTGARFATRINDLSEGGCFVDTMAPLPEGSRVRVCIARDEQVFDAAGKVVYFQPGLGMGIAFTKVQPEQRALLDSWLLEAGDPSKFARAREPFEGKTAETDRALVIKLIHLLVARGVLTEEEGGRLLRNPAL